MDWIKNLISYSDNKDYGSCPKCRSRNVEVVQHENGARKSLTFVCRSCNASDHFDGVVTEKD